MSIEFDHQDGIALITINRPDRMNAMDAAHYDALSECWTRVRDDAAIRVAVVTGAGDKSFSAGADLKSFITRDSPMAETWLTQARPLLNRGLEVWKPVVAAINGYCLGGGMTLMLATDIRVCVPHATFSLAEVKRGIIAANGGTQRVMAQLPQAIAMEVLLLGERMDAATALRWGLVNRIVEADELLPVAFDYARRLAANAPLAVQAAKELALRSKDVDLATGLRLEVLATRLLRSTEDAKEGALAFAQKRPAQFTGR